MRHGAAGAGEPLETTVLRLADLDIRPCRGCRACFDRGEDHCPLHDDVPRVAALLQGADAVVFASPVYVHDVSGTMKTLIDRLAWMCHRPALAGRSACLLATVGGGPAGHALRTMEVAAMTWGLHLAHRAGLRMGALVPGDELAARVGAAADRAAGSLVRAVVNRAALRPGFLPLMMFRIQQVAWQRDAGESTVDHAWWRAHGWLDAGCTFYLPHRTGPITTSLARLVGTLVAGIFAG
jgi:hypothetical protein